MKTKEYTKKDGTQGVSYHLENGDVLRFKKLLYFDGKFGRKYTVIVEGDKPDEDKFVQLTPGQAKFFVKNELEEGTLFNAEEYTNNYGTFVGIRFNSKEDWMKYRDKKSVPEKPEGLPKLKPAVELQLDTSEESVLNQLLGNGHYKAWKDYAKESASNLSEAMKGIANDLGVAINASADRMAQIYKMFISRC